MKQFYSNPLPISTQCGPVTPHNVINGGPLEYRLIIPQTRNHDYITTSINGYKLTISYNENHEAQNTIQRYLIYDILFSYIIDNFKWHYSDVIISAMASQITNLTIVYSTVYSGAGQRKHQSFASLAFVWGIHQWPVNSRHKRPVTRKMFPFDDVIMSISGYRLQPGRNMAWTMVIIHYRRCRGCENTYKKIRSM